MTDFNKKKKKIFKETIFHMIVKIQEHLIQVVKLKQKKNII